jgi:hypothetical protein
MRARTKHAAHNLAVLKHMTVNLIRLDPIPRKGGIKLRRLIAANLISIAHTCPAWRCSGKLGSCDCPDDDNE